MKSQLSTSGSWRWFAALAMTVISLALTIACEGDDDDDLDADDDDFMADDDDDDAMDDDDDDDNDTGDDDDDNDTGDDDTGDDDTGDDDTGDDDTADDDTGDDDTGPEERLIWTFEPPDGKAHVECVGSIEDIDGDDVPDILAHAFDSINTPDEADTTFCISGASGGDATLIWGAHPKNDHPTYPSDSGGDGDRILTSVRDLNGDGVEDVLLGTAWGNRTAYALDGADGSKIWMFCTYTNPGSPDDGWIMSIDAFPDVTGDGVPEAIFGVGSDNNGGYLVDGADGSVLWRLAVSDDAIYDVDALDDINGDDTPDAVLAGGDNEDRVFAVEGDSSGTGNVLWTADTGNNYCLATIADLNSDGYKDVLAGSWGANAVVAVNGYTGATLWTSTASLAPIRIVPLDDVNDDGVPDLAAVGLLDDDVFVIDGADGSSIWVRRGPASDSIWAVDRLEDINDDGVNDVIAGSFDSWVIAMDGKTGDTIWSYDTGEAKVMTVRGVPDVTGDGLPDVVAGTQCLDTSTPGSGTVFLLNGDPDAI
ncbi:MAG TPA: PQQ-binding-like beta-propeller repeat protein [bacterium]|nr:PQQ-binding-like beta-propeller repeat protein [bacterium]